MAFSDKDDMILPEILVDAIEGVIAAGITVMGGTGAAIVNTNATFGEGDIGDTVSIPYFGSLGEFEDVADGAPLTPVALTQTREEATVIRSGKAFSMTDWAATGKSDPYGEAARQLVGGFTRRIDKLLIDAALTADAPMTHTVWVDDSDLADQRALTYDVFTDARTLFGDEQMDIAALVVRSEVLGKMRKLRDGDNRPLLVEPTANALPIFQGIPVFVTDRLTTVAGTPVTGDTKYRSLILKRNSLSAWINGSPRVETDRDILASINIAAVNFYLTAHKYLRLPGLSKGGVVIIEHNLNGPDTQL